jgi:hypothetical protein
MEASEPFLFKDDIFTPVIIPNRLILSYLPSIFYT